VQVFAVVVVGPPGSGKTTVLTALHDLLADTDVAHAVIEAEAVAWTHPRLGDDQALKQLKSVCRVYEATGCELILVGATATSGEHLARILAAVGAADHLLVRLAADPSTLRGESSTVSHPNGQACSGCSTPPKRLPVRADRSKGSISSARLKTRRRSQLQIGSGARARRFSAAARAFPTMS
jgi:energy-coupling factor transporter ATP-binding protein EcfA2